MFTPLFLKELDVLCARHNIARAQNPDGTLKLIDVNGREAEGERMLRIYGSAYGLSELDFGTVFVAQGTRYKLVGLKTSRPKYPLQCEHMGDGRIFKFPISVVPQIVALRGTKAAPAPQVTQPAPTRPAAPTPAPHNPYAEMAQF